MDDVRPRAAFAFLLACLVHVLILAGLQVFPHRAPIVVSFPVELVDVPRIEQPVPKPETPRPQPQPKKEEIVIPKKPVPKPKQKPKPGPEQPKPPEPKPAPQDPPKQETPPTDTPAQADPRTGALPSISVDTAKFPFAYYLNQVRRKVTGNWSWSRGYSGTLKTVVYFRIDRSGAVSGVRLHEPSHNTIFDNLCLRAVEASSPFPPLPQAYDEPHLGVYFEFMYRE